MEHVPVEVLTHVLRQLGHPLLQSVLRVALVSRKFRAAADAFLAEVLEVDLKCVPSLSSDELGALLRRTPRVQRLDVDCWGLADHALRALPAAPQYPLQELALVACDHHTDALLTAAATDAEGEHTLRNAQSLQISAFSAHIGPPGVIACLSSAGKALRKFALDVAPGRFDSNEVALALCNACPGIEHMCMSDLTSRTLQEMSRRVGSSLRHLELKRYSCEAAGLSDATLVSVVRLFPALHGLEIVDHIRPDGSFGERSGRDYGLGPPRVDDQWRQRQRLTDSGIAALQGPVMQRMKVLRLASTHASHLQPHSDQEAMIDCSSVSLIMLANACGGAVEELHLVGLARVDDSVALEVMAACGERLLHLSLDTSAITGITIHYLPLHCPNLRTLSIKNCRGVKDASVGGLAQCRALEELNLGYVQSGVTDTTLLQLLQWDGRPSAAPPEEDLLYPTPSPSPPPQLRLKVLALNACHVTDDALRAFEDSGCKQSLAEVVLHYCYRVTCAGVKALAQACPYLQAISLTGTAVGDPGMHALAQHCRGLVKIRCDYTSISDPSIGAIARCCRSLRHLSVQNCKKVSDAGMKHLQNASATPSLRTLSINGTGAVKTGVDPLSNLHKLMITRPCVEVIYEVSPLDLS